ncbi:MAG: hypothetical protein NTX88_00070 [Candidatus Atribacteria bacterium]|nr:hypothetical protein [Candidatus Atribacteria bacterium]
MTEAYSASLDDIRKMIETYGKQVSNLKDQRGNGPQILHLRSDIERGLAFYKGKGAFVDSEETRLGNFDAVLQRQARRFVHLARKTYMESERSSFSPPASEWWWWLDRTVAETLKKNFRKNLLTTVGVGVVLFLVYFFIFRLPPNEKKYLDFTMEMERLVNDSLTEKDLSRAQALLQQATEKAKSASAFFPNRPEPYVAEAGILEKMGTNLEAEKILTIARTLYLQETDFLLDRSEWYFRLDMKERSKEMVRAILRTDPNNLPALNILGTVYEMENNVTEALQTYNRVLDLAEQQNQQTLIPVTKMKIAMLQFKMPIIGP